MKHWLVLGPGYVGIWVLSAVINDWSLWPPLFLLIALLAAVVAAVIPTVIYFWMEDESVVDTLDTGLSIGVMFMGGLMLLTSCGALIDAGGIPPSGPCTPVSQWNC